MLRLLEKISFLCQISQISFNEDQNEGHFDRIVEAWR